VNSPHRRYNGTQSAFADINATTASSLPSSGGAVPQAPSGHARHENVGLALSQGRQRHRCTPLHIPRHVILSRRCA